MQRINLTAKSIVPRIVNAAQKNQQCRKMGGGHGGGNHAAAKHGHAEPYAAKHGKDYPDVAYPFGMVPGAPLQGWEIPVYGFYFASFLICFIGIGYCKRDTTFTAWARREALAREKVVENGGEIEFGKWYQSVQFQEDEIDNMPIVKED